MKLPTEEERYYTHEFSDYKLLQYYCNKMMLFITRL